MGKVLKADFGSGPADAYVQYTHGSELEEAYISLDVMIPADSFAANLADAWLGVIMRTFRVTGGPTYIPIDGIQVNYFSDWSWDQTNDSYPGAEGITEDEWHTVRWHVVIVPSVSATVTWEVDGTNEGDSSTGIQKITRFWFGLVDGNADVTVDNFIYLDNLLIGTSGFGSDEILSADFEGGSPLGDFDDTSGDISVVDDPLDMGGGDLDLGSASVAGTATVSAQILQDGPANDKNTYRGWIADRGRDEPTIGVVSP